MFGPLNSPESIAGGGNGPAETRAGETNPKKAGGRNKPTEFCCRRLEEEHGIRLGVRAVTRSTEHAQGHGKDAQEHGTRPGAAPSQRGCARNDRGGHALRGEIRRGRARGHRGCTKKPEKHRGTRAEGWVGVHAFTRWGRGHRGGRAHGDKGGGERATQSQKGAHAEAAVCLAERGECASRPGRRMPRLQRTPTSAGTRS